jgi:hypothetical protein
MRPTGSAHTRRDHGAVNQAVEHCCRKQRVVLHRVYRNEPQERDK